MDSTLRCDRAGERLDPADFAALIQVLETTGRFAPDPLNPPWADPRPDLVGDHAQWWVVLQAAHKLDGADPDGVFGVLWGIRCLGAQLELAGDQTRLVRGDEMSEADWLSYRNAYLMPRSGQIAQLLRPADAAKIAHKRPVPPARTPARFTGNTSAQTAAPRKSQPAPTSQSALPTIASAPAPAMFAGGDW